MSAMVSMAVYILPVMLRPLLQSAAGWISSAGIRHGSRYCAWSELFYICTSSWMTLRKIYTKTIQTF